MLPFIYFVCIETIWFYLDVVPNISRAEWLFFTVKSQWISKAKLRAAQKFEGPTSEFERYMIIQNKRVSVLNHRKTLKVSTISDKELNSIFNNQRKTLFGE